MRRVRDRRKAHQPRNPPGGRGEIVTAKRRIADALDAVIAIQHEAWRDPRTETHWRASLRDYALPKLGRMRVDAIQTPDVLACLEPIWNAKRDTARRVKQRIAAVMDWAIANGHRQDNPVAAVASVLPKNGRNVKHHAALPYSEVPAAFAKLYDGDAQPGAVFALSFLVLTAARSGEVRKATWAEIDLEAKTWTVPAEHMKGNKEHVVPLSADALAVLECAAQEFGNDGIIFPSASGKALRDKALVSLLRDNDIAAVVHGFRSSFRDWAAEHGYDHAIAEAALAHTVRNAVEAAYRRIEFLDKRRKMMERWGEHCMAAIEAIE